MTIVAGVDFGTQSVRFSIFDSDRGHLGSGVASYPVLRRPDDLVQCLKPLAEVLTHDAVL